MGILCPLWRMWWRLWGVGGFALPSFVLKAIYVDMRHDMGDWVEEVGRYVSDAFDLPPISVGAAIACSCQRPCSLYRGGGLQDLAQRAGAWQWRCR